MSNYSNMEGLDLFTAPFGSQQTVKPKTAAPLPRPVKPEAPASQPKQPDVPKNPALDKKTSALQAEQVKAVEPKPAQKPQEEAPAPVKAEPKPEKELTMDMSDHTVPAGKPLDASEDAKRKAHEEAEAKRKAEWEAKQAAKKQAEEAAAQKLTAMSDSDAVSESINRIRTDVERLTRRNMKECVSDHIQNLCRKDPAFARRTMHPKKSIFNCFRYINRMAKDYIMEENDIKPENGVYEIPDDIVYQYAEDYFNDPDAPEDKVKEEKFTPRPYVSTAPKTKKASKEKKTPKKEPEKKQDSANGYEQMSFTEVLCNDK